MSRRTRKTKRPIKRDIYKQLVPRTKSPGADTLLPALDKPLPKDISAKIARLNKEGVRRTQIAKQLGVPKVHVIQELIRLGG